MIRTAAKAAAPRDALIEFSDLKACPFRRIKANGSNDSSELLRAQRQGDGLQLTSAPAVACISPELNRYAGDIAALGAKLAFVDR
jgi:hypothetical protein